LLYENHFYDVEVGSKTNFRIMDKINYDFMKRLMDVKKMIS